MILVDSNVLIDILDNDPLWYDWSNEKLEDAASLGPVVINHVIMAEVAPHQGDLAHFLMQIGSMMIEIAPLLDEGAFIAGNAFLEYRKRRQGSGSVLPDFLIGGHAQALGATILTRDPRFYKSYFPTVPIIAPSKDDND
jgi:predicted nucleic acid-binding protein